MLKLSNDQSSASSATEARKSDGLVIQPQVVLLWSPPVCKFIRSPFAWLLLPYFVQDWVPLTHNTKMYAQWNGLVGEAREKRGKGESRKMRRRDRDKERLLNLTCWFGGRQVGYGGEWTSVVGGGLLDALGFLWMVESEVVRATQT